VRRLGQDEVNSGDFDRDLAIALRLSAVAAQDNPALQNSPTLQNNPILTPAQNAHLVPQHLSTPASKGAADGATANGVPLMCETNAPCASSSDEVCMPQNNSLPIEKGDTPAVKETNTVKSATPATSSSDAASARGTKKKRCSLKEDSSDEKDLHDCKSVPVSPVSGGVSKEKQVRKKSQMLDDSDDEEQAQQQAETGDNASKSASNPGHSPSRGGDHEEVTNQKDSAHKEASNQQESSHIETDTIPDSEDEGNETELGESNQSTF